MSAYLTSSIMLFPKLVHDFMNKIAMLVLMLNKLEVYLFQWDTLFPWQLRKSFSAPKALNDTA